MRQEIDSIISSFFQKDDFDQVTVEEITSFIEKYPFVTSARFLLAAKKLNEGIESAQEDMVTAGLYFHNPLRLHWLTEQAFVTKQPVFAGQPDTQIVDEQTRVEPETETGLDTPPDSLFMQEGSETSADKDIHEAATQENVKFADSAAARISESEEDSILFQSYHTIDYFASQGIRLQQGDLNKDKLGQQLKSFTEWLKSMKKLPESETQANSPVDDIRQQQLVLRSAAHSLDEKEIITETMAEVWLKQGNRERARIIYEKLSLHNPAKSAYFAAKIDQIK